MAASILTSYVPFIDINGLPISGALVTVYNPGTTTKTSIFTDSGLTTPAANPLQTNANGFHPQAYIASGSYKIYSTTAGQVSLPNYSWDNIDTGVAIGSGALPVASGGTGATTAAIARTNLSVAAESEVVATTSDISALQTKFGTTGATQLATGTTAQQPVTPSAGQIRRNSTVPQYEVWDDIAVAWKAIPAGIAAQADMEAPTSAVLSVAPSVVKNHPGVAKAWATVSLSGGTPTLDTSYNVASIVDGGVGIFTINFTTAFSGITYCAIAQIFGEPAGAGAPFANVYTKAVDSCVVKTFSAQSSSVTTSTLADHSFMLICFGDQ